jgi:hypothetical protein
MRSFIVLPLLALFAVSCSSNRDSHEKLRAKVRAGELDSAMSIVKSDKFFPEKNSRLLKLMEGSLLQHMKGNYYQAMLSFDETKELSDQLFTVSISKKIASAVVNSNVDNYYGETYERSMIRFYQALNHYSLYMKGEYEGYTFEEKDPKGKVVTTKEIPAKKLSANEKQFHLTASRSTLLEWNALLDNYKATTAGKPVYKDDLLAKIFGAFIHEQMGSAQDKSIALGLYKEAKQVLFRSYNVLPTYNKKSTAFVKNFDKFGTMEESEVLKNYVEKTSHYTTLEAFIDAQIARLTDGKEANSVFILVENNFISPKRAKKFDFPIPVNSIPAGVGGDFMSFAGRVLQTAAKAAPKIYFEMPEIPYVPAISGQMIIVKDATGKVIAKKNLATLNPLTDFANFNLTENSVSNYAAVGARVAIKHVAALAGAYAIYNNKKGTNETLALMLAGGAYGVANKGIQMSEEADLRSWSILPHMYSLTAFKLKPGTYSVEYEHNKRIQNLGNVTVAESGPATFLKHRIHQE